MSGARGRRLEGGVDHAMQRLGASVDVDRVLWREDIDGSKAHARGLARAGVLSGQELGQILTGLDRVASEIECGELVFRPELEDIHMNVEARLVEIVGSVGGKLHTGRSRNDQVATDLRLWTRARVDEIRSGVAALGRTIIDRAEGEIDTLMPAYTHLQRGQPSRLAHHLLAWQEMLCRDDGRLADARARLDECPLGSGAVAGTGFPLDRDAVAKDLGFSRASRNSIDATASRDFATEVAAALAILGVNLSRIAEEIVLWSTIEFDFISLADEFSTSSSMMPQKKNPDVAELVRGKSARAIGSVVALLALQKSLPLGYNRDLQEDKEPLFDAVSDSLACLAALRGALATATFRRERMRKALDGGHLCATDLADYLASRGVPFREAHHVVGGLVRVADERGLSLADLDTSALAAAHPLLVEAGAAQALDPELGVERRDVLGGPSRRRVVEALAAAREYWQETRPS